MTIPNTRSGQCSLTSYDDSNNAFETIAGSVHTGPNNGFPFSGSISVTQSDGSGIWSGYYILSCMLPPKATLHTWT
jgi:hypothetical protein